MKSLKIKKYFKYIKSNNPNYSEASSIRIHRAISWFINAEENKKNLDNSFIFLWISFNAAYAQELTRNSISEGEKFQSFIKRIIDLDKDYKIQNILLDEFSQSIRVLLENKFVYHVFWEYQLGNTSLNWKEGFINSNKKAFYAILNKDTLTVMTIIFSRLYTLRNQIIHGGATYNSRTNRDQLRDGCKIMFNIMQRIISIMIDNPKDFSEEVVYPVIK